MSRSLQEYHELWQQTMKEWKLGEIVEDPDLTNESCVIFESAHSTPMGEGMTPLPDFGDAICYYRYFRVPEELEPQEPQERSSDVGDLLPGNIAEKLGATPAEAQQRSASYTSKLGEISTDFEVNRRNSARMMGIDHF